MQKHNHICPVCNGSGQKTYPDYSTWDNRPDIISLQAFVEDTCNYCWGSGDISHPGESLCRKQIMESIEGERLHQDEKWGGPLHDDEHTPEDFKKIIFGLGNLVSNNNSENNRKRFIQIAATAVAAIESIDRKEKI